MQAVRRLACSVQMVQINPSPASSADWSYCRLFSTTIAAGSGVSAGVAAAASCFVGADRHRAAPVLRFTRAGTLRKPVKVDSKQRSMRKHDVSSRACLTSAGQQARPNGLFLPNEQPPAVNAGQENDTPQ